MITGPLKADEVHIWHLSLSGYDETILRLSELLSSDEQARAERFHFKKDRQRFIVARAGLRKLLSNYLQIDPSQIDLSYNEYGKPSLAAAQSRTEVTFNLAHSEALALFAFTVKKRIGVDLEFMRDGFTGSEIAQRYFSPNEVAELERVPVELRTLAFLNCWTRKEAFVKALGTGLSLPLDHFDVSLSPNTHAALLETRWNLDEARRWTITDLDVAYGYVAAMAVEGRISQVQSESLDAVTLLRL